jgi:hypothetical protein
MRRGGRPKKYHSGCRKVMRLGLPSHLRKIRANAAKEGSLMAQAARIVTRLEALNAGRHTEEEIQARIRKVYEDLKEPK